MLEDGPHFDLTDALDPHGAAEWLLRERGIRRKPGSLANLRSVGGGPKFFSVDGAIRYLPSDLDEFARSLICGPLHTSRERASTQHDNQKNTPPGLAQSEGRETLHANRDLRNHGDAVHLAGLKRTCKAVANNGDDGRESNPPGR